jgi:flotillin
MDFSGWFLPALAVMAVIIVLVALRFAASRYKKIQPGKVGIFYGRKYPYTDSQGNKQSRGFMVLSAGGKIVYPFVEQYKELDTASFQVEISEEAIPNKDNVPVNVKGVATLKISTIPEDMANAAENFLDKTPEEINTLLKNIMLGHLRSIIGNLTIDELLRKRDEFNKKVTEESSPELRQLGFAILSLTVQDVNDTLGYIESLGKRAVAEVKREADIKVAEAKRDTDIQVSNAEKEAATAVAKNAALVAEAERDRDIAKAKAKVQSDNENAKANKALAIAEAAQDETLKVAMAKRDAAEKTAQIEVQKQEALRKEEELNASVVKQAEADRKRIQIDAEAAQKKVEIEAEAAKTKRIKEAEANAAALNTEAEAKKKSETAIGEGEAARELAKLTAAANGKKADLLAVAEGKTADAVATEKLAEALHKLDENGKLILILDRMPVLIDKGGPALAQIAEAIFKSVAAPLGNIDNLNIVDMGGNGKGLDSLSTLVPNIVFKFFAAAKAQGVDVGGLLQKIGLDASAAEKLLASVGPKADGGSKTTVDA